MEMIVRFRLSALLFFLAAVPASATVTRVQLVGSTNASGGSSISTTISASTLGNLIVVAWEGVDANGSAITVRDNKGNVYSPYAGGWATTNCQTTDCFDLSGGSSNVDGVIYYTVDIYGGVTNITVNNTVASTYLVETVEESHSTTGWPSNPTDQTVTNPGYSGGSTSWNSGTTGTTSVANELLFGIITTGTPGGTLTPGAGWGTPLLVVPTYYLVDDQIVSSTGTYSFTGTLGTSASNGALIATFKSGATTPWITPIQPVVSSGGSTHTFSCMYGCGTPTTGWTCANTGNGGTCLGSINSSTGVYTPPSTLAANQSIGGYPVFANDHVYNVNVSALPTRSGGATFAIASSPTGLVRNSTGTISTVTFSPGFSVPAVGTPITISGAGDSSFNGTWTVTAGCGGSCTSFSFANTGTANATSGGGTLTVPWTSGMGTTFLNFYPSIPFNYTTSATPTSPMSFNYTPANNTTFSLPTCPTLNIEDGCGDAIAGDGSVDHHFIGVRTDTGVIQEFYQINNGASCFTGTCDSQSGVSYNYSDYTLPGGGSGSTDAAGLGLTGLLLRSSELGNACANNVPIKHAVRMTVANGYIAAAYIWPATTNSSGGGGINPYGQRFRLSSSYNISGFSACAQIILTALKNYGVILADGGEGWQVVMDYDNANPTVMTAIQAINSADIPVTNWQAVDESSLEETALSGATTSGEIVTYTSSTGSASTQVDIMGTALNVKNNQIYIAAGTPQQTLTVYSNGSFTCAMSPTEGSISQNSSGCLYTAPASIGSETDTTITVTSTAYSAVTATMLVHIFPLPVRITQDIANYTDSHGNVWYSGAGGMLGYGLRTSPNWLPYSYQNTNITGTDKQLFWNGYYISGSQNDIKMDVLVPNGNYTLTFNNGTGSCATGTDVRNFYIDGNSLGQIDSAALAGMNAKWSMIATANVTGNDLSFFNGGIGNQTCNGGGVSSFSVAASNPTYYISYSTGSNSNNGLSEAAAWKSHPYMQSASGCGGSLPSYSHNAGDTFVFKQGDSWPNACFDMVLQNGGSSSSAIDTYTFNPVWGTSGGTTGNLGQAIGTYQFTAGGSVINGSDSLNTFMRVEGLNYVTINGVEFTGFNWSSSGACTNGCGDGPMIDTGTSYYVTASNVWMHGWTHSGGAINDIPVGMNASTGSYYGTGVRMTGWLIDGANSGGSGIADSGSGTFGVGQVDNTIIRNVSNAFNINVNSSVHDNQIGPVNVSFIHSGTYAVHSNCVEPTSFISGAASTILIYNNLIHDCSQAGILTQGGPPGTGWELDYLWNNIYYIGATSGPPIPFDFASLSSNNQNSQVHVWNNTIFGGTSGVCMRTPAGSGNFGVLDLEGNHCISDQGDIALVQTGNTYTNTDYLQGTAAAAAAGYTSTQTPCAYAPTSSSSPTVGIAANLTSDATGNFVTLQQETTCGSIITAPITRPPSGTWNAGAYQFSSSGGTSKPTGLGVMILQ
jgi:hypothetical protein